MNAFNQIFLAIKALEAGKLVAFPTETVYGLGADAENDEAVLKIYAAKGRPADHPLIVHVSEKADLSYWAKKIPLEAQKLIDHFWPGPLTLILNKTEKVSDIVSGGEKTVGLRCPSHPVAKDLLSQFKGGQGGIAAPSANRFGRISPTLAKHVQDELGKDPRLAMILDGGASEVGIESTILDLSRLTSHGASILRPGKITSQAIAKVIGVDLLNREVGQDAPRASGTLLSHYAPKTRVVLMSPDQLDAYIANHPQKRLGVMTYSKANVKGAFFVLKMPQDKALYSHQLYAALRQLDDLSCDQIVVEMPPKENDWEGINDRLRRAAH